MNKTAHHAALMMPYKIIGGLMLILDNIGLHMKELKNRINVSGSIF
ncbi:hypothetical protein [Marinomonas arctica]|uniref:Uncharacterized protein n=1 Tax=Marinomonas arctica TaxID=383750 RepID=A0A7H1J6X7_9GAMM|nr:hypothetical protein [Marinomonas arctica]QNT06243.1 hypothetical protein IBG28_00835 [Marinomonas arctica]GGN29207.1 hypothetical protein GCM10011350_21350 [Marinomonas arctica]